MSAKYVPAYVMTIPTARLSDTIIPLDNASLTGCVNSTEKFSPTGRIGKVNKPESAPLIHNKRKFLLGRVTANSDVKTKVPTTMILRVRKYFFVFLNYPDAINEPMSPKKIKQTPMMLVCFAVYP